MDQTNVFSPEPMYGPIFVSGHYYDTSSWWGGQITTTALISGREYDLPLWIPPGGVSVDRMLYEIVGPGGAGKLARVFFRTSLPSQLPGELIAGLDSGTFDANTAAINQPVVSGSLPSGLVYICILSDGTPTVRTYSNTMQRYIGMTSAGAVGGYNGYCKDGSSVTSLAQSMGTPTGPFQSLLSVQFRVA